MDVNICAHVSGPFSKLNLWQTRPPLKPYLASRPISAHRRFVPSGGDPGWFLSGSLLDCSCDCWGLIKPGEGGPPWAMLLSMLLLDLLHQSAAAFPFVMPCAGGMHLAARPLQRGGTGTGGGRGASAPHSAGAGPTMGCQLGLDEASNDRRRPRGGARLTRGTPCPAGAGGHERAQGFCALPDPRASYRAPEAAPLRARAARAARASCSLPGGLAASRPRHPAAGDG